MKIRKCLDSDLEACVALFVKVFAEPPYNEEWNLQDARAYPSILIINSIVEAFVKEE